MVFGFVWVYIEVTLLFPPSRSILVCFTPNCSLIFDIFLKICYFTRGSCVCVCVCVKVASDSTYS